MKILKLINIGMIFFLANAMHAQVSVNVNLNPPLWGPVGYSEARYYYLPDVEAYYDVQSSMFIYNRNGKWIRRHHLPSQYNNYDLYSGYKVVMSNYHGNTPHVYFKAHRMQYAKGYRGKAQKTIGNKPGKGNNAPNTYSNSRPNKNVVPAQGNNKNAARSHSHENKGHNNSNAHKGHGKGNAGGKGKK